MKHALGLILTFFALSAGATPAGCPEGFWDMGKNAAVVAFRCPSPGEDARLFFCQREALLKRHVCTGERQTIPCEWGSGAWSCHEPPGEFNRFDATIRKISEERIHYHAKSHFNEVDLTGTLIDVSE